MHDLISHHKKMVYVIVALMAGALLLAIIAALMVRNQPPQVTEEKEKLANVMLVADEKAPKVGEEFTYRIETTVPEAITGFDLLLRIDPQKVALVGVENVPEGFFVPRKLVQNDTIIVSILPSLDAKQSAPQKSLGVVRLKALTSGDVGIVPIVRSGPMTSMLLTGSSPENQITNIQVDPVTIQ